MRLMWYNLIMVSEWKMKHTRSKKETYSRENRNSQVTDSLIGIRKSSELISEEGSRSSRNSRGSNFGR